MIFLELFLGFLKVGCFSFGGAYSAIPLIRDVAMSYGWLDEEMLAYMIAVSESTPGPIMVNLATYVGSSQAGIWGSVIATLAVVLPAFLIILLITALLKTSLENKYVQAVLRGLNPCVIGIIFAMGLYMIITNMTAPSAEFPVDARAALLTALLFGAKAVYKRFAKKKLSPILLIVVSACLGIVIY